MPEFPGHTHSWLWREILGLRETGLEVKLASTRVPSPQDYARHAFVAEVKGRIFYVWPPAVVDVLTALLVLPFRYPLRVLHCGRYAYRIQRDGGANMLRTLALLLPAWRFGRWCRAQGIRHVHVATPANSLLIAQLAGILFDLTTDVTINAKLEWWGGAMHEKLSHCARIFVVADWMLRQIQREFAPAIAARTRVARHGVDPRLWNPGDRGSERESERTGGGLSDPFAERGGGNGNLAGVDVIKRGGNDMERCGDENQGDGPLRVVTVGRLHPSKGHQDLLRATAMLVARGRALRVEIAGGGPYAAELEGLIASLGLTGIARLLGPLSEEAVRDLLRTGDLFVVASHAEALGVVYMEAMALGLPVVGTTTDGALEVVEQGSSGLLVPPGDVAALAAAIEALAGDPERRRACGLRGRQRAEALFDSRIGAGIVSREIAAILSAET